MKLVPSSLLFQPLQVLMFLKTRAFLSAPFSAFMMCLCSIAIGDISPKLQAKEPVPFIFDTDIGNDVDDVLALGMIHSLQSRGELELLAVTLTKDAKRRLHLLMR